MTGTIRVVPEDLHVSANQVDTHAEGVQTSHASASGRIVAAQSGTPAASAVALRTVVAKWQADSAVMFGNMVGHGAAMRGAAVAFQNREQANAAEVEAVADRATAANTGL